jgi:hypothetical protein
MRSNQFFEDRDIEARRLPDWVLEKAESIIRAIETGTHFQALGGKRLNFDHTRIAIPVGPLYRMIAIEINGVLKIKRILSHEDYNKHVKKVRL